MPAYYNEIDPYAAHWLRQLIAAGHIADGVVDERSIEDIHPAELREFTQCHFFAGIGVWSRAFRAAGWPDERRAWTGSCPCQPFSAAGKGAGFADERHLWPAFHHLISECRPPVVFGEQVASKDGLAWLDLVRTDLEATGYAVGASDLCAAGIGAPHIRQRLWWVADADLKRGCGGELGYGDAADVGIPSESDRLADDHGAGFDQLGSPRLHERRPGEVCNKPAQGSVDGSCGHDAAGRSAHGGLDNNNNNNTGLERLGSGHCAEGGRHGAVRPVAEAGESGGVGNPRLNRTGQYARELHGDEGQHEVWPAHGNHTPVAAGADCGLADADCRGRGQSRELGGLSEISGRGPDERVQIAGTSLHSGRPSPTNSHWRDADWLYCRDGKWRPVEPGTFPLAHGAPARVGRLRAYGNAIVPQVAEVFIRAYLDIRG